MSVALSCCVLLTAALLAVANEGADAERSGATASLPPAFSGIRDLLKEAVYAADCISGPGEAPTPMGDLSAAECLAMFDDDEDGDCDLADYHSYLQAIPPGLELGYACTQPYDRLIDGEVLPVYQGFQGGIHVYLTIHDTGRANGAGFQSGEFINVTRSAVLVDTGDTVVFMSTVTIVFTENADGAFEIANLFVFLLPGPGGVDGRLADFTVTVELVDDPSVSATITRRVLLEETGTNPPCVFP